MLTVWTNCRDETRTDCAHAWRLGIGARPVATGLLSEGKPHASFAVEAGADGFVDRPLPDRRQQGLARRARRHRHLLRVPPCQSASRARTSGVGRHRPRHGRGLLPHQVRWRDTPDDGLTARPLAAAGGFTADGRLWALVSNENAPPTQTIGMFDGTRWHYRDLAPEGPAFHSLVAAAGSNVVVLSRAGLSVTTNNGATWQEVTDPSVLDRNLPFLSYEADDDCCLTTEMAFAGSSTLYVADALGGLWRSTDLITFHRVQAPARVHSLKSAGDHVLALLEDTTDLALISADGRMQRLTVR